MTKKRVSHDTVIYAYMYVYVCARFLWPRANAEAQPLISVQRGQKGFIIPRFKEKYVETKHWHKHIEHISLLHV